MPSIQIGKVFGISVELHPTFIWLIGAIFFFLLVFDASNLVPSLVLLTFLFVSVFVHELFHSLVCLAKNCKVERIVLMPIGGVSMTEEMPEKPMDEFQIAIAGPLFNFLVVFLLLALVSAVPALPWPRHLFDGNVDPALVEEALLQYPLFALLWVNLVLGAFNLFIPALPMDGGRVLRAILSAAMGHGKATILASRISTAFAFLMGLLGFLGGNLMLIIVAVFVYFGANHERDLAVLKETIRGADYGPLIVKRVSALDGSMSFEKALAFLAEKNLDLAPVKMEQGLGFVSAEDLLAVDKGQRLGSLTVGQLATPLPLVEMGLPVEKLMALFVTKGFPLMGVIKGGKLQGLLYRDSLDTLYQLTKLKKKFDLQY